MRSFRMFCTSLFLILLLLATCGLSWAGNASFTRKSTPTGDGFLGVTTADLNGDGLPDLVEANFSGGCNCFALQLAHSDGTFGAPVQYTFPFLNQGPVQIVTADANRDGKADVIIRVYSGSSAAFVTHILVYLGRGDGTLPAPLDTSVTGGGAGIVAADVNGDAKVDLVLGTEQGGEATAVMYGDGSGNFAAPAVVYAGSGTPVAVGDFDADGHADIALQLTHGTCTNGGCSSNTLGILYGNGAGAFTEADVFTAAGDFINYSAGDLDQNGTTDVVVTLDTPTSSGQNVAVLYGNRGAHSVVPVLLVAKLHPTGQLFVSSLGVSDFNGDLNNDFVMAGFDAAGTVGLDVFLRSATGAFTQQVMPFSGGIANVGNLNVGDFNRDRKPDFVFGSMTQATAGNPASVTQFNDYVNTTAGGHFDGCALPASSHGIRICGPGSGATLQSPVKLTAAGTWFQTLRKMELWIDGAKVTEEHFGWDKSQWFEVRKQLAAGSHKATFITAGLDNVLQQASVTFTVSGTQGCSHPSAAGVHVCSPLSGSIQASPVLAQAAATVSGSISRTELWIDGVKKVTVTGKTTLQTSVSVPKGSHKFTFFAFNTAGTRWSSSVTATVE